MIRPLFLLLCCAFAAPASADTSAQVTKTIEQSVIAVPSYATIAPLVLGAPVIADVRIRDASRVKDADAPGLVTGRARFYVEADLLALIRGGNAMPARISYLIDVPLDARGKPPKLKKLRAILFARPVAGHADVLQLTGNDNQLTWTPALDAQVRSITREVLATDAPPPITGIGNAFHVPGTLPGEGETQIFLETAGGVPVSLQILRRPGEQTRWSVSMGDIVDDSAGAPPKDTLLWYRLACGLPSALPASSLASEEPANARAASADYAIVLRELGPCS